MNKIIDIPEKERFKLNEVCGLVGVKPYVLRFWESEFLEISPIVDERGEKLYSQEDIETMALIKKLLFEDKLTIDKAKREMSLKIVRHADKKGPLPLGEMDLSLEFKPFEREVENDDYLDVKLDHLLKAKEKLNGIIQFTNTLKEQHHWN